MKKIEVSQHQETKVCLLNDGSWNCHYGYARSAESRIKGDIGQDYLCMAEDKDKLVFVLCDGISMSYYGDVAARFLGNHLCEWLMGLHDSSPSASLYFRLDSFLRQIASEAQELVRRHEIPSHIQGMLREVLVAKKAQGSAAVYACGRMDLPGERFPEGRMILAWQGDVRIRLWSGQLEMTACLNHRLNTELQWNSTTGPVGGMPFVYSKGLSEWGPKGEILLYSDGLQALDSAGRVTPELLAEVLQREQRHPSSDDMCLFRAQWDLSVKP